MTKEEILRALRGRGGYVSGEQLAELLGVSRAAIWKQVQALVREGYAIESHPHRGYRLAGVPDKLYPSEVQNGLQTKLIGRKVVHFDVTTSTNTVARQMAEKGLEEGAVVVAEAQTRGRGRLGRKWITRKGGLWLSVVLRPEIDPAHAAGLTLLAAVAVTRALREAGLEAAIKWPNDVLVSGKKICGILTEMSAETDAVSFIILGIGVNVNNDVPLETATSMRAELGRPADRVAFAQALLEELEEEYLAFKAQGLTPILWEWRRYADTLGRPVEVLHQGEAIRGIAQDVADDGSLVVQLRDGTLRQIVSGDCVHLRKL